MPRRPLALRSSAGAAIRTRHPGRRAIALGRPTALVAVVRVGNLADLFSESGAPLAVHALEPLRRVPRRRIVPAVCCAFQREPLRGRRVLSVDVHEVVRNRVWRLLGVVDRLWAAPAGNDEPAVTGLQDPHVGTGNIVGGVADVALVGEYTIAHSRTSPNEPRLAFPPPAPRFRYSTLPPGTSIAGSVGQCDSTYATYFPGWPPESPSCPTRSRSASLSHGRTLSHQRCPSAPSLALGIGADGPLGKVERGLEQPPVHVPLTERHAVQLNRVSEVVTPDDVFDDVLRPSLVRSRTPRSSNVGKTAFGSS